MEQYFVLLDQPRFLWFKQALVPKIVLNGFGRHEMVSHRKA